MKYKKLPKDPNKLEGIHYCIRKDTLIKEGKKINRKIHMGNLYWDENQKQYVDENDVVNANYDKPPTHYSL